MSLSGNLWNKLNSSWREMVDSATVAWDFTTNRDQASVSVVPGSVGATQIADAGVSNAKLANMAQSTIKGRAAGAGTGVPTDLSATQATAILDAFAGDSGSGGTKGLVPAPAAGDAAAGKFLKANGTFAVPPDTSAFVKLTSGSVSTAATLDLALGSYTAYQGIIVKLYAFVPVTDGVNLTCQFSTDNGANWIATGYDYATGGPTDVPGYLTVSGSGSTTAITMTSTTANGQVGNAANEGYNGSLELLGWQLSSIWPRVVYHGYYLSNASTTTGQEQSGGGANETAQDCTGLRFAFSSGNIASGNYVVYGIT